MSDSTSHLRCSSPFGVIVITATGGVIHRIRLASDGGVATPERVLRRDRTVLRDACAQLEAYFDGALRVFSLPLAPAGTPFQDRVWTALRLVPYGATTTYGRLAEAVGSPKAARAVGLAMNRNPITIVIPCHRVIGSDGSLTGYRGGLDVKTRLLEHEACHSEGGVDGALHPAGAGA